MAASKWLASIAMRNKSNKTDFEVLSDHLNYHHNLVKYSLHQTHKHAKKLFRKHRLIFDNLKNAGSKAAAGAALAGTLFVAPAHSGTNNDILKDNLSKTEEGKKQVESAKAQADADKAKLQGDNQQLDKRASSAEKSAAQARVETIQAQRDLDAKKSELDKATADLNNKKNDVDKATSDLNNAKNDLSKSKSDLDKAKSNLSTKQDEVDKANRCISLFNSATAIVGLQNRANENTINLLTQAILHAAEGLYDSAQTALDNADNWNIKAVEYSRQATGIFNRVIAGNC